MAEIEDGVRDDITEALEDLCDAYPDYKLAEEYAEGKIKEKYVTDDLRRSLTGSGNDFLVNMAGRVVTAVSDRMKISAVTAKNNETGSSGDDLGLGDLSRADQVQRIISETQSQLLPDRVSEQTEANQELFSEVESAFDPDVTRVLNEEVWTANQLDEEAPDANNKSLTYGDGYLFVWGTQDGEGVNIFFNSPMSTRVIYDDENPRKKKLAVKRWKVGPKNKEQIRMDVYYPEFGLKFISSPGSRGESFEDYRPYTDESTDEEGRFENPYGEIPIFHLRTSRPYGVPEHKQAYGPQDAITKLVFSQMTSVDFAAYPQRYALSRADSATDGDIDWGDDETQSPEEKHSNLVSGPGRVWLLDNVDKVGEFAAADADQFLKPLDKFIELMAAVTGTPLTYLNKVRGTSSTPLSGASQQETESILIQKIKTRETAFGSTWEDALEFAMRILGYDVTVSVKWESPFTERGKSAWEAVVEQQKAGVPIRQTLLEAGYTEAEVTGWGYTEHDPNGLAYNVVTNPHNPFYGVTAGQTGSQLETPEVSEQSEQALGEQRVEAEGG
jgi:hypothetical protein